MNTLPNISNTSNASSNTSSIPWTLDACAPLLIPPATVACDRSCLAILSMTAVSFFVCCYGIYRIHTVWHDVKHARDRHNTLHSGCV